MDGATRGPKAWTTCKIARISCEADPGSGHVCQPDYQVIPSVVFYVAIGQYWKLVVLVIMRKRNRTCKRSPPTRQRRAYRPRLQIIPTNKGQSLLSSM
jgi:hypothetical protein